MSQPGQGPMLIKPNQIDQLPFLDANAKQQYKNGLANLWSQYESNPVGSTEREEAHEKIRTASTKLMNQLAQRKPGSGAGPQRPNQPQQGTMQQQMGQQQQQRQHYTQQMGQMTPQQMQAQAARQAQARQQQQQQQQQQGQSAQSGQVPPRLSDKSATEINSVKLNIPPEQHQNWRRMAFNTLLRRDNLYTQARNMQMAIQNAEKQGQDVSQVRNQFEEAKKSIQLVDGQWKRLKAQGEGTLQPSQQPSQQQQQVNSGGQVHQQQQMQQQRSGAQQGVKQQQPEVKPEQRTSLSPAQPQNGFQQPNQAGQHQQGASTPIQPNLPQASAQPPALQQQTPQSATQTQQNFPQQQNMQQPNRPQINTQQMPSSIGPQQQTPASAMPHNSAQPNQQRPQPLTHQAAMSQAADAYSRSQQQTQQQQGQQPPQQMPNGLPFSAQPGSATQQNGTTYPNLQTTQQSSASTKFPIPKTLQLDPRTQTPVAGPASRPTLNSAGMMYNPGIQRPPPFVLEGEGDRVLSKRKLDELVRQVTGAAPDGDSSVLQPEVEESMLELADSFVDDLITQACKLAKMRPNQTLDIRDIQIVLERNYGIRVPGYSLDETRTVKKWQPAPGWTQKMQAVSAGKVMGSRES